MLLAENVIVAERFRLNRMIGRGGMGSVWHATHLGLDTECAVKFIEGEYAALPEAQQRFEREAKAAAQLRSPHVVAIMDHGLWEGTPYIAMELLDGEDLGKRLARLPGGRMPHGELNVIITQVCRALTKAHSVGIVHRDLKPDNIFLVRDDDREIAKVLDFGIAKKNTGGLDTGNNTKTGAMLGTPYYMSPEQAHGIKGVDWRSDLWSLAVIVFQAVTGRLPFESEALGDLLVKIIVAPVPVPSSYGISMQIAAPFDAWFARAADRDPAKRFQSAKELGESLALVLGQSAVTEMMDRGQVNAALAVGQTKLIPGGATPLMTDTPAYGAVVPAGVPGPRGMTTPQPASPMIQATTSSPYTLGGPPAGPAPRKTGAIVAAAVVGALLLTATIGGVVLVKGRDSSAASAARSASSALATPPATASAAPSAPAILTAEPAAVPVAAASAPIASAPPSVAVVGGGSPRPRGPAPQPPVGRPAPPVGSCF